MNKVRIIAATVAASAALTGCATGPNRNPNDPLEPMNRAMYKFNDTVDTNIAQPIAKGYQKVTPTPVRTAISNFFSNLGDLGNIANNLLQLRITDATEDLMRVAMNSVFGVAGLIDIATPAGLPKHPPGLRPDDGALGCAVGAVSRAARVRAEHDPRRRRPRGGRALQPAELHRAGRAQPDVHRAVHQRAFGPARRDRPAEAGRARSVFVRTRRVPPAAQVADVSQPVVVGHGADLQRTG